nr:hypothetical protein [Tanacetum cinerariifolium]
MKDWKTGFFYIDRRAIPGFMPWRHADSFITDLKPPAGTYDETEARRLSVFVVKLHDMYEGVLVLSGLIMAIYDFLCLHEWEGSEVQEEPHHKERHTLKKIPFYCTTAAAHGSNIPDTTPDELATTNPDTKVLAKKTLFEGSSDDEILDVDEQDVREDDDCVEISSITPIRSAGTSPCGGNQVGDRSAPSVAEGSGQKGARAKDIMGDRVDTPSGNVGCPQDSVHADPFDVGSSSAALATACDDIERDFFPSIPEPYYRFSRAVIDQFPTPAEVVRVEALFDGQLSQILNVMHCVMMSHGRELLAQFWGLIDTHNEYKLSSESKLTVGKLNEMAEASEIALIRAKEKSKARKKVVKFLTKALDQFIAKAAHFFIGVIPIREFLSITIFILLVSMARRKRVCMISAEAKNEHQHNEAQS